jgi:hypothetical protein
MISRYNACSAHQQLDATLSHIAQQLPSSACNSLLQPSGPVLPAAQLTTHMHRTAAVPSGRHTSKSSNAQADVTTGMASADANAAGDQAGAASFPQSSSGFMGMMSGMGAAAHKGSPHKAAEMLSMSQSPTAEKVGRLAADALSGLRPLEELKRCRELLFVITKRDCWNYLMLCCMGVPTRGVSKYGGLSSRIKTSSLPPLRCFCLVGLSAVAHLP